uniref:Protein phosphatase 1 regulatory subunit 1A n=1 Tax=Crocodylus porosus TaxID=8502 RepID=A0A7M4FTG2_CROPO
HGPTHSPACTPTLRVLSPQIRRRRPTPATLVLSSDQSSPEVDEDRVPNPLLKVGTSLPPARPRHPAGRRVLGALVSLA